MGPGQIGWLAAACSIGLTGGAPLGANEASAETAGTERFFPFVLPWDDASPGVTNLAAWLGRPAGAAGAVTVRDGHFYVGEKRLRFLGVNLCFGACFPTHEDAERIAARMARFGINCVRFHHMDNRTAPAGIFKAGLRDLDPGQLDKLDYLVAQLKNHGIYVNLNLHVSRVYPGLPTWEGMPSFHKGVDNFVPQMIEMQREYARHLLTHVNPYTKTRYADEPAVAIVEINNENGLIHEWLGGHLDAMPDLYADELSRRWNDWLRKRYPDQAALRESWGVREAPLGAELLVNGDFAKGTEGWRLEQHEGAAAQTMVTPEGADGRPALRVTVTKVGQAGWHIQVNQGRLALAKDVPHTLTFQARADRPRRITVNAGQAHAPWQIVWSSDLALTAEWQTYHFTLAPGTDDDNLRVNFTNLSQAGARFEFAGVSLRPGGLVGLRPGEGLGRIEFFRRGQFAARTGAAQRDWLGFLHETERDYWQGLSRYLKQDLGVRAAIVGTIVGCSTPTLMAGLDAVDSHAYWQHPRFPGRPWDPANWFVTNTSLVNSPGGPLTGLALRRVAGKPHLVTEYNHSAPNTYSSEAPLLLAAVAGLQDWDGIFLFAYSHRRDDWDARRFTSFFDIDQHPTKMANLPLAAAMFLRGDVRPARQLVAPELTAEQEIELLRRSGRPWQLVNAGSLGVPPELALLHRIAMRVGAPPTAAAAVPIPKIDDPKRLAADTGELVWDVTTPGRGLVKIATPWTRGVVGFVEEADVALGDVTIRPGPSRQGWCTVGLTLTEGKSFAGPARALVVATGFAENTAMRWLNDERSTVGRNWGRAPSLVEGIEAIIRLPAAADRVRAWALDERGQRGPGLPVRPAGDRAEIRIGPEHRTLWYEVEIVQSRE